MSVLIKGMDTPYGCADCNFVGSPVYDSKGRAISSCNVPVENIRGKDVTDHVIAMYDGARMSFPKWCPLVELPEKHGRLIDADKCEDYFWEHLDDNGMAGAMNAINDMPTIVEAEDGS